MAMFGTETLNLKNFEELNKQVEDVIPSLIKSLTDSDKKASLTITLNFNLYKDSESTIEVTTSVKPSFPSRKRKIIASRDLEGNLSADVYDLGMKNVPAAPVQMQLVEGSN
ncbi:hypothetical protein FACS1894216_02240 [Synergistales bacterium]|nr:hypothetical protein FACS1894216_02240 [Synergistales bacterium]